MKTSRFDTVLEAVERLSLEERESLVQVVKQRTIEERRAQLVRDVAAARRDYKAGKFKIATVEEIMREIMR